ncbi:MAG: heat-inducible transcriptional repressor HrcA [Gammaproteobacteria bacterium]|nr:heat-inducible transcriptional repressor HrcA [Gammaproteobacteria bacterium]MCP5137899.1 heat-inducible transcriptional repressor HrcA [Gammaproteobacteria bacterium]
MSATPPPLKEREQALLKALIELYIRDGQPVGSRTLAKLSGMELSPATVRNVLADLEDMGLLASPHTSAGRVPTDRGYRLFVDSLVQVRPVGPETLVGLQNSLRKDDASALVRTASSLLSDVTSLAGLVTVPHRSYASLRQIEFLPLTEKQVLAIIVVNEREVENRVIRTDRAYTRSELESAANYINAHFAGRDLAEVRVALLRELRAAQQSMNEMMLSAISMAEQALEPDTPQEDFVLSGETRLMNIQDMADMNRLRGLFEAFQRKQDILNLLDFSVKGRGVQIFIGQEAGLNVLDGCSLVTAPYRVEGEVVGVLGVLGPTRMSYESVIPVVDITAKLLGAALQAR